MRWLSVSLTFLQLAAIDPLYSQRAVFIGTVTDSLTGAPISQAHVGALNGAAVTTAADGRFTLIDVPGGNVTIQIRKEGFKAGIVEMGIEVFGSVTVDLGTIGLNPVPLELEPIYVETVGLKEKLDRVGFYGRRNTEQGTFLSGEDIERRNPTSTSELLLHIPAFRAALEGEGNAAVSGRGTASMLLAGSSCPVTYYVDGVHAQGAVVDDVLPNSIGALELYAGPATTPPRFRYASQNAKCGVVIIWTITVTGQQDTKT